MKAQNQDGSTIFSSASALWLAYCLLLLVGCATSGPQIDADDPEFASIGDPTARKLLMRGRVEAAADRYSKLAQRESDPQLQQDYQLIAAEILYDRGRVDAGALKLAAIQEPLVDITLQQRLQVLRGKDALFNNQPEQALASLPDPEAVESTLHRARTYEVQAQSYRQLQQPDLELAARVGLDELLETESVMDRNHVQIWQLLTTQPLSTLREMTTNVRDEVYQGWVELALVRNSSGVSAKNLEAGLTSWRQQYPEHPASQRFVNQLYDPNQFAGLSVTGDRIEQIAVLLPLTAEGIGSAAGAIRDGIVLAYQNNRDTAVVPEVRFYDTSNTQLVRAIYQSAVQDGADAVIGPLRKDAVAAIISQRSIPVPTLTLNYVDSLAFGSTENLIQFGLAPEDEARAAANRALALNYKNAIVLQSDDSRGDRESRAFQEEMLLGGGDILHTAVLPVDEYDYSRQIRDSLLITQSDQRFRSLSNAIGEKLFFEPAIRDDLDVIFLAVTLDQAKSVRPQLSFFRASAVPKFGTSRVETDEEDIRSRNDLNGIFFTDAPWILDKGMAKDPLYKQAAQHFGENLDVFSKLYALGIDAYGVVNNLQTLVDPQAPPMRGYTGELTLTSDGRIRRSLLWAQYQEGVATPVPTVVYNNPLLNN
ncbi:MAG: penicillin-binding protein activator [Gammaproteobacteria bacterium]|nr:penicillin-binding protein activator [Gammaproteobacteria bacterium]